MLVPKRLACAVRAGQIVQSTKRTAVNMLVRSAYKQAMV